MGSYLEGIASRQVGWIAITVGLTGALAAFAAWRLPNHRWPAIPGLSLSFVLLLSARTAAALSRTVHPPLRLDPLAGYMDQTWPMWYIGSHGKLHSDAYPEMTWPNSSTSSTQPLKSRRPLAA